MANATLGPWRWKDELNGRFRLESAYLPFDTLPPVLIAEQVREADARLIAAAPDLLAACQAIVAAQNEGGVGEVVAAMDLARAAIAKATGA